MVEKISNQKVITDNENDLVVENIILNKQRDIKVDEDNLKLKIDRMIMVFVWIKVFRVVIVENWVKEVGNLMVIKKNDGGVFGGSDFGSVCDFFYSQISIIKEFN